MEPGVKTFTTCSVDLEVSWETTYISGIETSIVSDIAKVEFMKILVSEYVLSTFRIGENGNYVDLLPEAYAIVFTLVNSLNLPGVETYLTMSSNLPEVPWGRAIRVNSVEEYYDLVKKSSEEFDGVVLIAPPRELTALSKLIGEKLIGPPSPLVDLLSDKYCTHVELERCGLRTPRTMLVRDPSGIDQGLLRDLNPPYVVKPSSLAGSECVYVAENVNEVLKYANLVARCDPGGKILVQEFISGFHGSISVIYGESGALLYSLNLQLISMDDSRIKYMGGILPVRNNRFVYEAELIVDKLFNCYPVLRGYIGLDVVWNKNGVFIVEANPRLTTSFIGMSEIYPRIGKLLLDSKFNREKIKETGRFLGDLSRDYAYYLVLSGKTSLNPDEKIIEFNNAKHVVLVGRTSSRETLISRVRELLFNKQLAYELEQAI
ncbi:MAG: ATP-grasp domain-containing protein [Desulfurococcaceae archaeon]